MKTFNCLICNTDLEVETNDDGHLQAVGCPECHIQYHFGKRQSIIDNKLCGAGGQWNYDFVNKGIIMPEETRS